MVFIIFNYELYLEGFKKTGIKLHSLHSVSGCTCYSDSFKAKADNLCLAYD